MRPICPLASPCAAARSAPSPGTVGWPGRGCCSSSCVSRKRRCSLRGRIDGPAMMLSSEAMQSRNFQDRFRISYYEQKKDNKRCRGHQRQQGVRRGRRGEDRPKHYLWRNNPKKIWPGKVKMTRSGNSGRNSSRHERMRSLRSCGQRPMTR